ncbi:gliding motility lipoprotein GldD [Flavobacteriales bacterium]|nr:gliding motility lipoprotein GldD [Flavobacteriales bacterium]
MRNKAFLFLAILFASCDYDYTPKPRAFFKIDLPSKEYKKTQVGCPFIFDMPLYSTLEEKEQECFYNLNFPNQNCTLHITYLPLNNNLLEHTEESRSLAYKHDVIADAIAEEVYINTEHKVYGILYDYYGTTATSAQFYLTDSINHFFRGALYFNAEVSDSLLPVNNFLKKDIRHIIESFRWKDH